MITGRREDISYLQHQLGHSSLTTTAIYLQARPNHRRKAYEKAGFDGLLIPPGGHAERLQFHLAEPIIEVDVAWRRCSRTKIHEDRQGEGRCPGDPALIALRVLFQQCLGSACCIAFSCYG
jgi:hypothetical protein